MILTFVVLVLMKKGQPALLYLVPCTLVTASIVAWRRKEMKKFWKGSGYQVCVSSVSVTKLFYEVIQWLTLAGNCLYISKLLCAPEFLRSVRMSQVFSPPLPPYCSPAAQLFSSLQQSDAKTLVAQAKATKKQWEGIRENQNSTSTWVFKSTQK